MLLILKLTVSKPMILLCVNVLTFWYFDVPDERGHGLILTTFQVGGCKSSSMPMLKIFYFFIFYIDVTIKKLEMTSTPSIEDTIIELIEANYWNYVIKSFLNL